MNAKLSRILTLIVTLAVMLAVFAGPTYAQSGVSDKGATPEQNTSDLQVTSPNSPNDFIINLPAAGVTTTTATAWSVTNKGTGRAGLFNLDSSTSANPALDGRTASTSSAATGVFGLSSATSTAGAGSAGVRGQNYSTTANGYGVAGFHNGAGAGVYGQAQLAGGRGVYGLSVVTSGLGIGIYGESHSPGGYGGYFLNTITNNLGVALYAESKATCSTIIFSPRSKGAGTLSGGSSQSVNDCTTTAIYGKSPVMGVYGDAGTVGTGVFGKGSTGVLGSGSYIGVDGDGAYYGVFGSSTSSSGYGIYGETNSSIGVYGSSYGSGNGVRGTSSTGIGVLGSSNNNDGVQGFSHNPNFSGVAGFGTGKGAGVYGQSDSSSGYAGYFVGRVRATVYSSNSAPMTLVDNPIDSTKSVQQAGIISSEQLSVQTGNVTLDKNGEAVVTMPAWYDKIYGDFRYNLTTIGSFAPLYVVQEMKNNQFKVAGGKSGMKVSWQVSVVRQDKYAKANPLQVEVARVAELPLRNVAAPDALTSAPMPTAPQQPGENSGK